MKFLFGKSSIFYPMSRKEVDAKKEENESLWVGSSQR